MSAVIYDPVHIKIYATYLDRGTAERMLKNAREKGYKLQGRRYRRETLDRLDVTSEQNFRENVDHYVEVKNLMSGKTVTIKASDRGGCTDPSTETYWSM